MDIKERENIVRDSLKKLMGLPPYDGASNLCKNDGYFYQSIIREHGNRLVQRVHDQLTSEISAGTGTQDTATKVAPVTPVPVPKVTSYPLDTTSQEVIDRYIEIHRQYKELEKQLEELKPIILDTMQDTNNSKVKGTEGGALQVILQERPSVTSKYTSYELEDVEQFLSARAKKICIVRRIDREKLEALMTTGEVDEEVSSLKRVTSQVFIKVDHR